MCDECGFEHDEPDNTDNSIVELNWKRLFFDLLDEVEQIPHPMAEELWEKFNNEVEED